MRFGSRIAAGLLVALLAAWACAPAPTPAAHQPLVDRLVGLLEARPALKVALGQAVTAAQVAEIDSVDAFYRYVNRLLTWIPTERETIPKVVSLHYVINHAPGDVLNTDPEFSAWLHDVAQAWGAFLDTPASAAGIPTFTAMPDYRVDDYTPGPSGWQTFNQFFARQIKPGKRPVADPQDDTVVVSPADAIVMGTFPVTPRSTIAVKDVEWRLGELLAGSAYADAFANGSYMHTFLSVTDYHRYHVPVGGVVREVRNVHGRVYLDVVRRPDGTLRGANGDTYQFTQERGLVVIESPLAGLVAIVPVGMSTISSVNLTPEVGAQLRKGEEFGFFAFGGSDIVMIFQDRGFVLEAEAGTKYLQGQRIGRIGAPR